MANVRSFSESRKQFGKIVGADQEAWLLDRLTELVITVKSIQQLRSGFVGASEPMMNGALEGAVNGAAIEIIHILGLEPGYVNIREQGFNLFDRITRSHISSISNKAQREKKFSQEELNDVCRRNC